MATAATPVGWGIYVHVPFCRRRCPYCPFNVHVRARPDWAGLEGALAREWAARNVAMPSRPAATLYLGGGTPSLAPPAWVAAVVGRLRESGRLAATSEVTLEVNPGTVDQACLEAFARAGVNRLSIGWQSSHDRHLAALGRDHDARAALAAPAMARAAGFDNISLDLIFAVPGQSAADLDGDLAEVARARPEHVSMYALTYHRRTPFWRWRRAGRLAPAGARRELAMMAQIRRGMRAMGLGHYEISNFARLGRRARHNQMVWRGGEVLGLGPGAHSFAHRGWRVGWRWANVAGPEAYVAAWAPGRGRTGLPTGRGPRTGAWERLAGRQLLLERMLTGLRTADGVRLDGPPMVDFAAELAGPLHAALARGRAVRRGPRLGATPRGRRHADLLAELFVLPQPRRRAG